MKPLLLTCDEAEGRRRAAVWREGKIIDLYSDVLDEPDLTGALVRGKAKRVTAQGSAAWFEAGKGLAVYVENVPALRVSDVRLLRIRTTRPAGKAATGIIEKGDAQGPLGLVAPPPSAWERALADRAKERFICRFSSSAMREGCREKFGAADRIEIAPLVRGNVHPEIDDLFEEITRRRITLRGGGEVVIDETEALTAIDINAPEGGNPTAVNLIAIQEIARRIRLCNVGGTIVVDALRMKARPDKDKVLNALRRACADDPAGVSVFGITKLGLIEMTRTRRGPSLYENMGKQ